MTVNYSVIVSCSAHFPPGGRNLGSTTDRIISNLRYNEVGYDEVRLYLTCCINHCMHINRMSFMVNFCYVELVQIIDGIEIN